jgi:hypothetical protein
MTIPINKAMVSLHNGKTVLNVTQIIEGSSEKESKANVLNQK